MKPRTKLQFQVVDLSNSLPKISENEKKWAYEKCLQHEGFATKSRVICLVCGETFSPDLVIRKTAVCPHCQTKLNVEPSRKTTDKQTDYFAIAEVVDEFQVIRNFELISYHKKGEPVRYFLQEILQYWILPSGKYEMIGLNHHTQGCCDSWGGYWEIRKEGGYYYNQFKYDVYPQKYHPDSVFKPAYLKLGINHQLEGMNAVDAIKTIPLQPKLETLLKAKQYSILSKYSSWKINRYWPSIKICFRNKYKVKDASTWFDYLELLEYFKKDLSNAKYVCPKNLKKEHDRLVAKKREIQRQEERERERQRAIERQMNLEKAMIEYVERNQMFLDLEFKKDNISIKVLQSVDEFKEEGDELKHCVFTNEYYLRNNSLIFSARVDGKRTETIELQLSKMKIEQSRGFGNNASEYNQQIVALMKRSIPKIRKIINQAKSLRTIAA